MAAAAVGAGLAVSVDQVTDHAKVATIAAGQPWRFLSPFTCCAFGFFTTGRNIARRDFGPIAAGLVLLTPFTGYAVR